MASFNFYLKDAKAKNATSIYLLFDDSINRCKIYIQESINPKDWNQPKGEARKSLTGFADFNSKLKTICTNCENIHRNLTNDGKFTVETLRDKFKLYLDELNNRKKSNNTGANQTFDTLSNFAEAYIKTVETSKRPNTILQHRQTLRLLKEFESVKRKKITFERVTLDFYHDFMEFLTSKNLSPNTKGKHVRNVKLFLNEATERGINTKFEYKSKRFKVTSETVVKIYLTEDEILRIYEHDFRGNERLERVRDLFVLGCYTGLRFSDFSELKKENIENGFFKVKTQKTGETVVIPIHWTVKNILEKYEHTAKGLPRELSNQKMNAYLKEMGRVVGIDEKINIVKTKGSLKVETNHQKFDLIGTHTARRSFATNLYKSGFPAISIMKITGHKTEKSFLQYIKISGEENAEMLREHWSKQTKLKVA